jgi:hypothetical protein
MYNTIVMLKNRKTTIASNIFDTINKLVPDENRDENTTIKTSDNEFGDDSDTSIPFEYSVTIPTETHSFNTTKPNMICMYQVRTDGLQPFIVFLLRQNENEVSFIPFPGLINNKKNKYAAVTYMKIIFSNTKIAYAGCYETKNINIIILKCIQNNMDNTNEYIWATSFEIINKRKILHYPLANNVLDFFQQNSSFLLLKNSQNVFYESPMIGYYKAPDLMDIEEMDIYRQTIIPALGKCYYLLMDIPLNTNVMRIAFFAGRMALYNKKIDGDAHTDSILCREYKRYIIQNYNQHVVLSVFKNE